MRLANDYGVFQAISRLLLGLIVPEYCPIYVRCYGFLPRSLHLRRIQLNYSTARHIVDAITLASEGFDAGTVLALWFDQCGRAIRYSREPLEDASDIANVSDAMLNEYSCWTNAQIGQAHE